jgi:predicted secreted protein
MGVKLGDEMKLYLCAAGIGGTPAWTEVPIIRDVTLSHSKGEADVSVRGAGGWKRVVGAMKEATIEFEMVWDTEDAAFQAIKDAYFDDTLLGLAVMDGDVAAAGSEGLWADCAILKFDRKEPLDGAVTVGVKAKPTYSANPPTWKVIGE